MFQALDNENQIFFFFFENQKFLCAENWGKGGRGEFFVRGQREKREPVLCLES